MALSYTSRGPGYGVISTPMGDMFATPEQAASFGIAPPQIDEPTLDPGLGMPPPMEQPAPTLPPPPEPEPQQPIVTPPPPLPVTGQPFARVPQQAAPTEQAPPLPASTNATPAANAPEQAHRPRNLSTLGYGDVLDEQQGAIEEQAQAGADMAEAQAAGADRQALALEQRNAAIAAKEQEFAQQQAADQAKIAQTAATYEAKVKEFAEAKVDRSQYRVSPLAAIGVLISGIGSSIKRQGDKNPALDLLMRQIDDYVEDGYRKKAALGQDAAMVKDHLGMLQGAAANTIAQKQLAIAGLTEKAARDLEAIGAKQTGIEKRTAILGLAADARMAGAQALGQAVQLQHGEDQAARQLAEQTRARKAQIGLGYAQLRENARQADMDYGAKMAQRSATIAAAQTEADKALAQKEVADLKMRTVGPDGQATEATYRAKNEKNGDEVAQMHASVKTLDALMAEAERIRDNYPTFAALRKSDEYQKLMANVSAAGIAWAKANQMGAWDNGTARAVLGAQGGDPMREGYLTDTIGRYLQGDAKVGLEQFRKNTVAKFNDFASSVRDPRGGDYVPIEPAIAIFDRADRSKVDEQLDAIRKAKTPEQIRADAAPNKFERGAGYVFNVLDKPGERLRTGDELDAETAASRASESSGRVTQEQAKRIDGLVTQARSGGKGSTEALKGLEALAVDDEKKRPGLSSYALEKLAEIGEEGALSRVEAAYIAAAPKTEGDKEAARAAVRFARENVASIKAAQGFQAPPSIDALATAAAAGDKAATSTLLQMASGKQALNGPPITADQRLRANAALAATFGKRKAGR